MGDLTTAVINGHHPVSVTVRAPDKSDLSQQPGQKSRRKDGDSDGRVRCAKPHAIKSYEVKMAGKGVELEKGNQLKKGQKKERRKEDWSKTTK